MAMLTKYGTLFGDILQATGRVHFVAPASPYYIDGRSYSSSDNLDGLSPERALATIAQAVTNATASAGEIIALLPGTHTSAANVAVSKADLTFVGLHPHARLSPDIRKYAGAAKVNWTSTFAGNAVTVTAADVTFAGINFIPLTARTAVGFSALASRMSVIDCAVTLSAAASTSTKGFVASGAADLVSFVNCYFLNTIGAQGPAVDLTACTHFMVEKCTHLVDTGSWAVAAQLGAGSTGTFRDNDFICSGTAMTKGIDGTGVAAAKSIILLRNFAGVSPGAGVIAGFGANTTYCELGNNYTSTIGGGTGSTLITATT